MTTLRQIYDSLGKPAPPAPTPSVAMLQEACAGFPGVESTASGVLHPATKTSVRWSGPMYKASYINSFGNETSGLDLSTALTMFAKEIKDFNETEAGSIKYGLEAVIRNMKRLSDAGGCSLRISPQGLIYFATGPNSHVACGVMDVVSHLTRGLA